MHLIQEIGSYAGLAAVPGLAILAALYFSQARDVKRLREWAGRAPERAAEQAQGGRPMPQPASQAARAAQPAAAAQPASPAAQPAARAAAGAAVGAGAATAARGATATAARPATAAVPRRGAPRIPGSAGSQTAILGTAATAPEPWYRQAADRLPAGRYLALILVGIAIVGGGVAYAVSQSGSSTTSPGGSPGGGAPAKHHGALVPGDVTVTVLNGTSVARFARTYGHRLETQGFKLGNLENAVGGTRAHSVVMFKPGANKAAALVARKLHINSIQPADAQSAAKAGSADVIVVLGQDRAPSSPAAPATGGGAGTPGAGGTGTGAPATGGGAATPGAGGTGTGTPGTGGTGTPGTGGTGTPGQ